MEQLSLLDLPDTSFSEAQFSPCRTYRYALWRGWAAEWRAHYALFIGLNPSTADETVDDPTLRRCCKFAQDWGYAGVCLTNLFAYRATDPKAMLAASEPIGAQNDQYLLECAAAAGVLVAAWGNHGKYCGRDKQVGQLLARYRLHCLKVTQSGMPAHPLYLPKTLRPVFFEGK